MSKNALDCFEGARGYGLISFRTQISKDLRIKYSEVPEVVTEKMGQELIFGVFLLKNWT